jgi:hypothetical protein
VCIMNAYMHPQRQLCLQEKERVGVGGHVAVSGQIVVIYTYIYIHAYIHTYVHTYIDVGAVKADSRTPFVSIRQHTSAQSRQIAVRPSLRLRQYMYACMYACMFVCVTQIYTNTYIKIYIYIYI